MDLLTILLSAFTDWLIRLDRDLFTFIHSTASSPSIDWFFQLLRHQYTWIPLYAFLLYWVVIKHKKFAWQFIVASILVFAITDHVSASVMKPMFVRLRPCFDPELQSIIRDLVGCGGRYGMPSTHASNHFGLASFWFFTINFMANRKWYWLWIWAFAIGYAQVYVGKHFPGDILAGALLGTFVGWWAAILFRWLLKDRRKS
jgi:membrane-associated phospholipid phosphatase